MLALTLSRKFKGPKEGIVIFRCADMQWQATAPWDFIGRQMELEGNHVTRRTSAVRY